MFTSYELEAQMLERAASLSRESERRLVHSGSTPSRSPGRTTSLRVAVVLRAMADRLEARALRAA